MMEDIRDTIAGIGAFLVIFACFVLYVAELAYNASRDEWVMFVIELMFPPFGFIMGLIHLIGGAF